ncbi:MAG: hypothetical protein ACJ780_11650 [Solirubrobacteraceae bacterium]
MIPSHRRLARIAVTACCAVSATGAMAAAASAATLTPDKACYVNAASAASMRITGSGWTPGTTVQLSTGTSLGATLATATADAAGVVTFTAPAPVLKSPGTAKTTRLTATAVNADASRTSATVKVQSTELGVATLRRSVRNVRKDKIRFSFSGFVTGKNIYAYYIFKNKVVAKARFRQAQGPCGLLKQDALLYPGGRPAHDSYKVTFESSNRYRTTVFARVTGNLSILHF